MSYSLNPPGIILIIGLAALLLLLVSALRGKGNRTTRYVRLGVGVVAIGALLIFAYRPSFIRVDSGGISSNSGGSISIPWAAVSEAEYLPSLEGSPYRPTSKIGGIALGAYRIGTFRTAGKGDARVVSQGAGGALIVVAGGKTYEFAPTGLQQMVAEVAKYRTVTGWTPSK